MFSILSMDQGIPGSMPLPSNVTPEASETQILPFQKLSEDEFLPAAASGMQDKHEVA